ncbi:MAG TPA: fluoride efflux transporter CrcB [Xanthomonadales bacterium]|nr:fluoride efflux transporter CrcB [Xanthomonadales bacterium]
MTCSSLEHKVTALNFELGKILAVALGGAFGASLRYLVAATTHGLLGHAFPYGTLLVNTLGSLLIGYLVVLLPDAGSQGSMLRLLLITGLLGGFTTYSAFSIETLTLLQEGQLLKAGLNIALTLFSCLLAVWIGFLLARAVHVPH